MKPKTSIVRIHRCFSTLAINEKPQQKKHAQQLDARNAESHSWSQLEMKLFDEKPSQERVPANYWKEQSNQRKFFDNLGKKIGIQTLDDWYQKLSQKTISNNGGASMLHHYKGSPVASLMAAYPDHNWLPWKFSIAPSGFMNTMQNQQRFFDELGKELGVQTPDDWYQKLSYDVLQKSGGRSLLKQYNQSPTAALLAAYPEHNWILWKFSHVPKGFWKEQSNQRKFFEDLGKQIGIQTLDDWYQKLSRELLTKNGCRTLMIQFNNSPMLALMAAFPEHNWAPWKFQQERVPRGYWKDVANQRIFFDTLGKQIGIQTLDDWYEELSLDLIIQNGGSGLVMTTKNNSPAAALMAAYPELKWKPWKFTNVKGTWDRQANITQVLGELSEKLSIQTLDDWYRVGRNQLSSFGVTSLVRKYNGLYNLLKEQYPNHPWDPKKFEQVGRKTQRWLAVILKKMFPNEEILEDYMHPKALLSSNRPMQLDVFIPSKSLAFEYQGKQHYEEIGVFGPTKTYQQRDEEKRILCAANNIKLIEVPYWWNRTQESLQEIISKQNG